MKHTLVAIALLGAVAMAVPARADVKAGVDAWTSGDYAGAVREWVGPAQQGDPDAQYNLAQAYRLGRGVDADPKQAEALYERAAAQGHARAADNLGLLLFQRGERERAMPYITAAAGRGDPRAQYILGIAHFNGDLAAKDWRRAYALLTLANSAGLPQAKPAIQQMDQYIPLEDRQAAQVLATSIKAESDAARARETAAVDLALGSDVGTAGTKPEPVKTPLPTPVRALSLPTPASATAPVKGSWKVQLGAFGVPGNADRLWSQLEGRNELAGKTKLKIASGSLTRLLAEGFASRAEAQAACAKLKQSGQTCLVMQ